MALPRERQSVLSRAGQTRTTEVVVKIAETTIKDGIVIMNANTLGGVSVANTNIRDSGSAGNTTRGSVSIANTNIDPGIGGRIETGAKIIEGRIVIGKPPS